MEEVRVIISDIEAFIVLVGQIRIMTVDDPPFRVKLAERRTLALRIDERLEDVYPRMNVGKYSQNGISLRFLCSPISTLFFL